MISHLSQLNRCVEIVCKVRVIPDNRKAKALASELSETNRPQVLGFLNAHAINLCWEQQETASAFLEVDILLRDGKGLELLYQRMMKPAGENMNGTDFIPLLLSACKERKLALYGTAAPWLKTAAVKLQEDGHQVVDLKDGFQSQQAYVDALRESRADVVVLAMGMPKQEQLAAKLASECDWPVLIVCGGAILDFIAGRHPRAPVWIQQMGFEWAYRLAREPLRLFNRYVVGNVKFLNRAKIIARAVNTGNDKGV